MSIEGWNDTDFRENRQGRLSPAQARDLEGRMRAYVRDLALIPLVPLLGFAVGVAVAIAQNRAVDFGFVAWGAAVLTLTVFAGIAFWVNIRVRPVRADLRNGRVAAAIGAIDRIFVGAQSGQVYVRMGSTRMTSFGPVWQRSWRAGLGRLRQARRQRTVLRAYYLPTSRLFVAAEPENGVETL